MGGTRSHNSVIIHHILTSFAMVDTKCLNIKSKNMPVTQTKVNAKKVALLG